VTDLFSEPEIQPGPARRALIESALREDPQRSTPTHLARSSFGRKERSKDEDRFVFISPEHLEKLIARLREFLPD
jgi:hypothetical protein